MNTSKIGDLLVSSRHRYVVYGATRGLVSQHKNHANALASLRHDRNGCQRQGGYSDAAVYRFDGAWILLVDTQLIDMTRTCRRLLKTRYGDFE